MAAQTGIQNAVGPNFIAQQPNTPEANAPARGTFGTYAVKACSAVKNASVAVITAPFKGIAWATKGIANAISNTKAYGLMKSSGKGVVFGMVSGQFGGMLTGAAIGYGVGMLCGPGVALTGTIIGAGVGFFAGMCSGGSMGGTINAAWEHHNHQQAKIDQLTEENARLRSQLGGA